MSNLVNISSPSTKYMQTMRRENQIGAFCIKRVKQQGLMHILKSSRPSEDRWACNLGKCFLILYVNLAVCKKRPGVPSMQRDRHSLSRMMCLKISNIYSSVPVFKYINPPTIKFIPYPQTSQVSRLAYAINMSVILS